MTSTADRAVGRGPDATRSSAPVKGLLVATLGGGVGLLTAVSPLASVAVGLLVGVLLLLKWWREFVPVLAIALIYSNAVVILAQRGTVPASAGGIMLAALGLAIVRDIIHSGTLPPALPGLPFVLLFGAMQCLSTLFSVAPSVSESAVYGSLTEGVLLFVLVGYAVLTTRTLMGVVNALLIIGAVLGALSTIQHLTGDYTNTFFGFAGVSEASISVGTAPNAPVDMRLNGNIGETNRYAQVLAVLLPLAAIRFATTTSVLVRIATTIAAGLIGAGIVFTYSRGTVVALVLTLLSLVVVRWVRLRWLVGGASILLVVALLTPAFGERLASVTTVLGATQPAGSNTAADAAVRGRTTEMIAGLLAFADRPALGVGPGAFPLVYPKYAAEVGIRPRLEEREAHDLYVGIAADTGILGLIPFLLVLWSLVVGLARASAQWWHLDRTRALLARGFSASILVYAFSGIFLHLSYVRYFWLLAGLAAAAARLPSAFEGRRRLRAADDARVDSPDVEAAAGV